MTDETTDAAEDGLDTEFDTELDNDIEADEAEETVAEAEEDEQEAAAAATRTRGWQRILAFVVLPALAVLLGAGAGFLHWKDSAHRDAEIARAESMAAAREATVALLSYRADTVEQDLMAARQWTTGAFLDSYTNLIEGAVIPAARQKKISAVTRVPAAAPVSADPAHAVVLVFVNQSVTIGSDPPTDSASSVRVTLDKVEGRWLVSAFDPV